MRKTSLILIGSVVLAASSVQVAAAAPHHRGMKAYRSAVSEPSRNANAYEWSAPLVQPDWSHYEGGAVSAPAGR